MFNLETKQMDDSKLSDWDVLVRFSLEEIGTFLMQNPKYINWRNLSMNPTSCAEKILKANFDKINWFSLSSNPAPWVEKLLRENPDKINMSLLSKNSAIWAKKLVKEISQQNTI